MKKTREELRRKVFDIIDSRKDEIIAIGDDVFAHPEMGFKENRTTFLVRHYFEGLGLTCVGNLAITGCKAMISGSKPGPRLAVLGELDAIFLKDHDSADPVTHAAHACGHNVQVANLLAVAAALSLPEIQEQLAGSVVFMAVPAEEFLDVGYRLGLVARGEISYCGGKTEMLARGEFSDIDTALLFHAGTKYASYESYNGFCMKRVTFKGKAAHAGIAPQDGLNALNAARIALAAIDAQRETFKDEDAVRVHGIISDGGSSVNVVPDSVSLEIQVRAKTVEAISDASEKVDRAIKAGALAIGCSVTIENIPGYMPVENCRDLAESFFQNVQEFDDFNSLSFGGHRGGSTDVGDLSMIMPVLHAETAGCGGAFHQTDFCIADTYKAYIEGAKILAGMVVDLMYEDASACKDIVSKYRPRLSREEYTAWMKDFSKEIFFDPRILK